MKKFCSLVIAIAVAFGCMATTASAAAGFVDVPSDAYYAKAVSWAVTMGVTAGVGDNMFAPDDTCTRAQAVAMLWRLAGRINCGTSSFVDVPSDAYYAEAVAWAAEKGVTEGIGDNMFGPDETCTRAQIVSFIWRARGYIEPDSMDSRFVDVPSDAYYAKAVAWAVENGVTEGVGDNMFAPDDYCTRAQIVSFLCRADQINEVRPEPQPEPQPPVTPEEAAEIMLGYVNDLRAEVYGSHEYDLKLDPKLVELAQIRAGEISKNFSHSGGTFTNAGENICMGFLPIKGQFDAWLNSPGHKANMLTKEYKYFGYGLYGANGEYGVQLFWTDWHRDGYFTSNQSQ